MPSEARREGGRAGPCFGQCPQGRCGSARGHRLFLRAEAGGRSLVLPCLFASALCSAQFRIRTATLGEHFLQISGQPFSAAIRKLTCDLTEYDQCGRGDRLWLPRSSCHCPHGNLTPKAVFCACRGSSVGLPEGGAVARAAALCEWRLRHAHGRGPLNSRGESVLQQRRQSPTYSCGGQRGGYRGDPCVCVCVRNPKREGLCVCVHPQSSSPPLAESAP